MLASQPPGTPKGSRHQHPCQARKRASPSVTGALPPAQARRSRQLGRIGGREQEDEDRPGTAWPGRDARSTATRCSATSAPRLSLPVGPDSRRPVAQTAALLRRGQAQAASHRQTTRHAERRSRVQGRSSSRAPPSPACAAEPPPPPTGVSSRHDLASAALVAGPRTPPRDVMSSSAGSERRRHREHPELPRLRRPTDDAARLTTTGAAPAKPRSISAQLKRAAVMAPAHCRASLHAKTSPVTVDTMAP